MTKKLMQRGLIAATLAALIGGSLLTTDALAWRGWHGRQQYENLAPEKQATYDAVMKEYHAKMAPLMEKMMAKMGRGGMKGMMRGLQGMMGGMGGMGGRGGMPFR